MSSNCQRIIFSNLLVFIVGCLLLQGCDRYEDTPLPYDNRLDSLYCNDPRAVNYNWNFPGTPDSSVCFYPSDVFKGDYIFYDVRLDADGDTLEQKEKTIHLEAIDLQKLLLTGWCEQDPQKDIFITGYRQQNAAIDSVIAFGQTACDAQDTLTGIMQRIGTDSLNYQFKLHTPTGVFSHNGLAIKQ